MTHKPPSIPNKTLSDDNKLINFEWEKLSANGINYLARTIIAIAYFFGAVFQAHLCGLEEVGRVQIIQNAIIFFLQAENHIAF